MKTIRLIPSLILLLSVSAGTASAQQQVKLGENAALRYWSAFAQMQDFAVTDQQAKEAHLILEGSAPYDDAKYKDLVEKYKYALQTMARGTALPRCDWGVDYQLGPQAPVDYVRKALPLGLLNVFYAYHLLSTGDKDGAVRSLAAGFHFSRDVANGGTLFATLSAKNLLVAHLRAGAFAMHKAGLSAEQRLVLQKAFAELGPDGLDWQSAMKRELEIPHGLDAQGSAAQARITTAYLSALNNPSTLPELQQMIASAPQPLPDIIPNPKRVLEEKQDLSDKLLHPHSLLQ